MCKKYLKQSLKVIFGLAIFAGCLLMPVWAHEAVELTDYELDQVYAAGFEIDINTVDAAQSAIAAQSNLGGLFSLRGDILDSSIQNSIYAKVFNVGNTALAAQSNIAVAATKNGNIDGLTISNSNEAYVNNTAARGVGGSLEMSQFSFSKGRFSLDIGNLESTYAGVAMQNNIAAVVSLSGDVNNVTINNSNYAEVINTGNTALAAQNNIAVVISRGGSLNNISINNLNEAGVSNIPDGIDGGVTITSLSINKGAYSITIDAVSAAKSAVCVQNNIGITAVLKGSGTKNNVSISNINRTITINNNL